MANRLTLISDPTNEFPDNKNNSFRMRIPNGLRLEEKGWHVALLSLTLPNRTTHQFATGHGKTIVRSHFTSFAFKNYDSTAKKFTGVDPLFFDDYVYEADIASSRDGISFWNNVIRKLNVEFDATLEEYIKSRSVYVFTKQTMIPTFKWEGEDLVLNKRGRDVTNDNVIKTALYSAFDIAQEVAVQWGLAQQVNGVWVAGPNLQMVPFDGSDKLTADDPPRTSSVTVPVGIGTMEGPTFRFELRNDRPVHYGYITAVGRGTNNRQLLWQYTASSHKWIRLSGMVEWRFLNLNRTYDAIYQHPSHSVMVYTNLQQSTIVGEKTAQLLREIVVTQSAEEGHSYAEPKQLQWIPVASNHMDIAEVQLADVNGKLLSLPSGKSLVTVAFKQMV